MTEKPIESQAPNASFWTRVVATMKTVRWLTLVPVPIAAFVIIGLWSPDGWRAPAALAVTLSLVTIAAAMSHFWRRTMFPLLDLSESIKKALGGDVANAILSAAAILAMAIVLSAVTSRTAAAQDVRTYIPQNAVPLLPVLRSELAAHWPDHPAQSYFGALIEHESCVSLTNSRCWNSKARLRTSREEGASLGQFTRAWREDGSLRFDAIAEVRALDPTALKEFSWSTVYDRAELSMRAILVKQRDCAKKLQALVGLTAVTPDVIHLCDAAYNGGWGGMQSDRAICAKTAGCDPRRWFGHVERHSLKSRTKWQGYGKSAFDINRFHVSDVWLTRRPKYMVALGADRV